jgi:hypothetical protein
MIAEEKQANYNKEDPLILSLYKIYFINFAAFWVLFTYILIISYKTNHNYVLAIFTLFFAEYWCYITHYITHNKNFEFIGFIHLFHHTPKYADAIWVFLVELLLNFFIYGGFVLIFLGEIIKRLFSIEIFNNYVLFFWSIVYSSYHLINFHYLKSPTHKEHHLQNGQLNYGPDWMDIIFGTKLHDNPFEDFNSSALNGFIGLTVVLLLKQTPYDPIRYIESLF